MFLLTEKTNKYPDTQIILRSNETMILKKKKRSKQNKKTPKEGHYSSFHWNNFVFVYQ